MFTEYLKTIASTEDVTTLKKVAQEIYNDEKVFHPQKKVLLQSYKQKMQEIHRAYISASENRLFKSLYFLIKKAPAFGEVGVILHELKDQLGKTERDILFQLYDKKKFANGNGNGNGKPNPNSEENDPI